MQEEKISSSAYFITFTYATEHLPVTKNNLTSLDKRDVQLFFKRLRKSHTSHPHFKSPIKYYCVGEYGTKSKRPHYHALIFNADIELIEAAWKKDGNIIGDIYYGDVSGASVGYTLKYMSKQKQVKSYRKNTQGMRVKDDRIPEFALMSKGLGISYITENRKNWHLTDLHNRKYLRMDERKINMPRYYYQKIYDGYQLDLLKMSGSLIQQDEFFKQFKSKSYKKSIMDLEKRIQFAFSSHEKIIHSSIQKL